jgi:hypothetical protein
MIVPCTQTSVSEPVTMRPSACRARRWCSRKGSKKSGIPGLVDHGGRWCELAKAGHELEQPGIELLARRLPPLFVIAAPCSRHVARTLRRYEPRKDGTLWKSMAYRQDHRQHPLHPGRSPGPVGRENALHMMHRCTVRGVNGRGRRSSVMSSPFVSSGNIRQHRRRRFPAETSAIRQRKKAAAGTNARAPVRWNFPA